MAGGYRFWIHGVAVRPEYTKEYTGTDNGLFMRPSGYGTIIRQKTGTNNWFHFAIPSATLLNAHNVLHYHAWLRFKINAGAVITAVHVRENIKNSQSPVIWNSGALNISGKDMEYGINLEDTPCQGPLVICVNVHFKSNGGEIIFVGAGGHFEELAR